MALDFSNIKTWKVSDQSGTTKEVYMVQSLAGSVLWRKKYTVAFNANGGTGSTASQIFAYGIPQDLNLNRFSYAGHTFNGWNTKANGSGTSYSNGQHVSNLMPALGDTTTLYAQWTADTVTEERKVKVSISYPYEHPQGVSGNVYIYETYNGERTRVGTGYYSGTYYYGFSETLEIQITRHPDSKLTLGYGNISPSVFVPTLSWA